MRCIIFYSLLLSFGFLFPGNVIGASDPTLTIVSPVSGDELTTDPLLVFDITNVPLDGSYLLEVYWTSSCLPTTAIINEEGKRKGGFCIPVDITQQHMAVPFPVEESCDEYEIWGYVVDKDDPSLILAEAESIVFSVTLLKLTEKDVLLTPVSKTVLEEPTLITIGLAEEVTQNRNVTILYTLYKGNENIADKQLYENGILLDLPGKYNLNYTIKIDDYELYWSFASYTVEYPSLTIVYPVEGETITTDDILLTFNLKGIPLDGSYILNVECAAVAEVTGTNKSLSESEPTKNIFFGEYFWSLPITSKEITVPATFFMNDKYKVRGYITEKDNTAAPVVADEQNLFFIDLPIFEQKNVFLTPESGTLDQERIEITVCLENEEIEESDVQIFYRVSKNKYYPGEYEAYENKIVLEEHGNYWVEGLIKVKGYKAFGVSGRYFIDKQDHSPSLILVKPDSERIIRDGNVMFYFEIEDGIWNGDYKIHLSVVPLPEDDSDPYYSEGEVFEIPVTSSTASFIKYLPNYKYDINAALCKEDGKSVAEIEGREIIVEELRLSEEDIIVTPLTTVVDDRIEVMINLREGLPEIESQYVWYKLCGADDNCTNSTEYEGVIALEDYGEHYIKFEIIVDEYMPYGMVVGPYTIQKGGGSDIQGANITKWYVQNKVLYLSGTSGDLVEVFTMQGINLYSSYVVEELVSIAGLPEDQLLLVKVNNDVLKVILK